MSRPPWWHWEVLLASGLGSGLVPRAPGTFGSLAALLPWWGLRTLPVPAYLAAVLACLALGLWLCHRQETRGAGHDPGWVVIDEWVGLWLALFLLPPGWPWLAAGFVLFRLLDIAKPGPVGWCDRRLPGGWGVMVDDLVAGALVCAALQLLAAWLG
ncbi:MAG: phosphatidylglycerophosphatase A [Lysobacteraceae bacterium]|nr:MAG: phosphatidylglycerophosphatase A [Xanthomonadaceae bacterium]